MKYHLIRWGVLCKSKKKEGLGIEDIWKMGISLLSKWWWKLETEDGIWQTWLQTNTKKWASQHCSSQIE